MNPITIRLLSQQLICRQFTSPTEVVSHFGAMQAQDYRMMQWAVCMRTKKPTQTAFQEAFNSGDIIRMHLLRCTWQLITRQDYSWMLELCADKSITILNGWMKSNNIRIPKEEHIQVCHLIEHICSENNNATKDDIADSLTKHGVFLDNHHISYHIRLAELEGLLVSGNLHPSKATYTLTSNKIKQKHPIDREEALVRLTTKYFQSHNPATLEDFVWWSGLNISDCKKGMHLLGDTLQKESWKERFYYSFNNCMPRGYRKDTTLLLPPFDEYLIGYKSRDLVLAPEVRHHAHNNFGIFYPVIAQNGIICGNWSPYKSSLQTKMFDTETTIELQKNWLEYQKYHI